MSRLKPFIAKCFRPSHEFIDQPIILRGRKKHRGSYLKETPYWATASNPDFQTSVTSHEVVAWSLQERKAEIALLPTTQARIRERSV